MDNFVMLGNPKRKYLALGVLVAVVLGVLCLAVGFTINGIFVNNLNGQVVRYDGVVASVSQDKLLTLKGGQAFSYAVCDYAKYDFDQLTGKSVTVISPTSHFLSPSNGWLLGLEVDGQTVIDYNDTISYATQRDEGVKTGVFVGALACGIVACAIFIVRANMSPQREYQLSYLLANEAVFRQPFCPQKRKFSWVPSVLVCVDVLSFALFWAYFCSWIEAVSNNDVSQSLTLSTFVFCGVFLLCTALSVVGFLKHAKYVNDKQVQFYKSNFPFDYSNVSCLPIRKKVKQELQAKLTEWRNQHPFTHSAIGNGYQAVFTQDGVLLYDDQDVEDANKDVFDLQDLQQPIVSLPYSQLHLQAKIYYFSKPYRCAVVVQSNLDEQYSKQDLWCDLLFAYDVHLANTLAHFGVQVEGLQQTLDDLPLLMQRHCPKAKPFDSTLLM